MLDALYSNNAIQKISVTATVQSVEPQTLAYITSNGTKLLSEKLNECRTLEELRTLDESTIHWKSIICDLPQTNGKYAKTRRY